MNWYCERVPASVASVEAPDLVLLHGWGLSAEVWRSWLPLLRRRCNVILLDLPGFGRSPAQPQLSVDELLDQLAQYIPPRAALLGWSLGGALAAAFSARYPERCAALMTIGCNPCFVARADWPHAMAPATFTDFETQLQRDAAATLRRFLALQVRSSDGERELLRWLRGIDNFSPGVDTFAWGLRLLAELDVRAAIRACALPGVHIFGAADALVPAAVAAEVSALNAQHWTVLLDGAAHLPFVSHGELCWQHLDRLLSSAQLRVKPPPPQRSKQAVANSFSRAAASYDGAAALQRAVADELLRSIEAPHGSTLLDIGCGTGAIGAQLAHRFHVIGLDLAEGMLRFARERDVDRAMQWLCADAENLPLADASIDVVFSSLALQWCENPGAAFSEIARVLRPGGSAWLGTLGPATLFELRDAWRSADDGVHVNQFAPREQLEEGLRRAGLTLVLWREQNLVMRYQELRELTRELKALGAHNVNTARPAGMTSRARLQRFSAAYEEQRDAQGLLPATYQVWYLQVRKAPANPH